MTEMDDKQLQAAITQVLEQRPVVSVPADFAARVAARVPARREGGVERVRWSVARTVAMIAMVVVVIAMFVLAPHVQMKAANVGFVVEMLLLLELAGIGYSLMRMRENGL